MKSIFSLAAFLAALSLAAQVTIVDQPLPLDGELTGISGAVMEWNSNMQSYIHSRNYTAYFIQNETTYPGQQQTFRFYEVYVGDGYWNINQGN